VRAAVALILLLVANATWAQAPQADPVRARVFEVRFKPLADAADVVSPLLSAEGTVTLRPRLKSLVIEDRASVLERVASLLESFDLPPRSVQVTFTLLLGSDHREGGAKPAGRGSVFSRDVRGVIEALGDFTKWTDYEALGSRLVVGSEGDRLVADLSDEYRVTFTVGPVTERLGEEILQFDSVVLERRTRDADGTEHVQQLHDTSVVLAAGRLGVVGAANSPGAKRALFLALQAETR